MLNGNVAARSVRLLYATRWARPIGLQCRSYHVSNPPGIPISSVSDLGCKIDGRSRLSAVWAPSAKGQNFEFEKDGPHGLLVKAGFLHQAHSGLFQLLPLGLRVQDKIEHLIDKHMSSIGASKLSLSSLSSESLWKQSGRLDDAELLRVQSKRLQGSAESSSVEDKDGFLLCPTHEEEITALVARTTHSPKSLPIRLYQISRKYRDELRPRGGLLRTREFVMKDLYTFDLDETSAMGTYHAVLQAYKNFFDELKLPYIVAEADSGAMGGNYSHEFHFVSPAGEDTLFACDIGGRPGCGYVANSELAESRKPGVNGPYASPYGEETAGGKSGVEAGDGCPRCAEGQLIAHRAVELGHTFHLGTRYSVPLGASVPVDRNGEAPKEVALSMGCHGIGVSRIIGAVAAIMADARGLKWPKVLAPWEVVIIPGPKIGPGHTEGVYDALQASRRRDQSAEATITDIVIDDRADTMISKLKDADLVGYSIIVILGKAWKDGRVEVQCSRKGIKEEVPVSDLPSFIMGLLQDL